MSSNRRLADPHSAALLNRLDEAHLRALNGFATSARRLAGQGYQLTPGTPPGAIAVIGRFCDRDLAGQLRWCEHLQPASPEPAAWAAWDPDRLWCIPCVAQLPPPAYPENFRCDACGTVAPEIWEQSALIPARLFPRGKGKPLAARGPVQVILGLCLQCKDAPGAEPDCPPLVLDLGHPLTKAEAAGCRHFLAFARAFASGTRQEAARTAAAGSQEDLLSGAITVVTALADQLLKSTPPSELIPQDIGSLLTENADLVARAATMPGPLSGLPDGAAPAMARTAGYISGSRDRAGLTPGAIMEITGGAALHAVSLAQAFAMTGLAPSPDAVWAAAENAVSRHETAGRQP